MFSRDTVTEKVGYKNFTDENDFKNDRYEAHEALVLFKSIDSRELIYPETQYNIIEK